MPYRSSQRRISMLLAGDVMLSRRLSPFVEPEYLDLVQLVRGADVAFANLETVVREAHEGHPNFTVGTPMSTEPQLLDELKWMGFDIVSVANNHATDYSVGGVQAMLTHLRHAELPAAGAGMNLAQARMPAYVDTPAGRVGLVAATSFFRPWNAAADQRPDALGRPGVNPLGFRTRYGVDSAAFGELKRISDRLGLTQERARHRRQFFSASELPPERDDSLDLFGAHFARQADFSVSTQVSARDRDANLQWIREARRQCDWLIFSFHCHEFGNSRRWDAQSDTELDEPAEFAVEFAHAAIDAGADVVAGHGPHVTLGVELYRGRPIFYSLGNFIFQNDTVGNFPAGAYERFGLGHGATPADFLDARTDKDTRGFPAEAAFWESFAAELQFDDGRLSALRLHPLDLGHGASRAERGRPMLARGDKARHILERLSNFSRRFGTETSIEGETLLLRLPR
ncbi:MAG: CapA family protein [Burkholderiales bacterium]|nr:CapA family protein [Burkholderiales bacterium]